MFISSANKKLCKTSTMYGFYDILAKCNAVSTRQDTIKALHSQKIKMFKSTGIVL